MFLVIMIVDALKYSRNLSLNKKLWYLSNTMDSDSNLTATFLLTCFFYQYNYGAIQTD